LFGAERWRLDHRCEDQRGRVVGDERCRSWNVSRRGTGVLESISGRAAIVGEGMDWRVVDKSESHVQLRVSDCAKTSAMTTCEPDRTGSAQDAAHGSQIGKDTDRSTGPAR